MERTLALPKVNLSLLRSIYFKFEPLVMNGLSLKGVGGRLTVSLGWVTRPFLKGLIFTLSTRVVCCIYFSVPLLRLLLTRGQEGLGVLYISNSNTFTSTVYLIDLSYALLNRTLASVSIADREFAYIS